MEHPKSPEPMRRFAPGTPVAVVTAEGLDRLLDYRAPEGGVGAGDLVEVPLGPRRVLGAVWGEAVGGIEEGKLRGILRVLDAPPLGAAMMAFLARAAEYTLTPLPAMLRLATRAPGLGGAALGAAAAAAVGDRARPDDRGAGAGAGGAGGVRRPRAGAGELAAMAGRVVGGGEGAGGAGRAGARGGAARCALPAARPGDRAAGAVGGAGGGGGDAARGGAGGGLFDDAAQGRDRVGQDRGLSRGGGGGVARAGGRRWCCCRRSRCRSSSSTGSRRGSGRGRRSGTRG